MIDATIRGALRSKTHIATYELLEQLTSNNYQWPYKRAM
jgi:hypothetical protein